MDGVSFYPNLFDLLVEDPSWMKENLQKLAGENLTRGSSLRRFERI